MVPTSVMMWAKLEALPTPSGEEAPPWAVRRQLQEPRDLLQQQRREEGQEREEEGRPGEFVFIGKNKHEGLKVKIYTCHAGMPHQRGISTWLTWTYGASLKRLGT